MTREKLPKIFILYSNGSVGEYASEVKALIAIRNREFQGTEVITVIIGHKLGMVTSMCEVVHCFVPAGKKSMVECRVPEERLLKVLGAFSINRR